jgi:hypothetical protein
VRPVYWTTKKVGVGTFIGENELEVRCEVEPAAAATKYVRALEEGDVPVTLLFSGRVLYMSGEGLQMAPIPWAKETTYRIPVSSFRNLIGQGAPAGGTTWI